MGRPRKYAVRLYDYLPCFFVSATTLKWAEQKYSKGQQVDIRQLWEDYLKGVKAKFRLDHLDSLLVLLMEKMNVVKEGQYVIF